MIYCFLTFLFWGITDLFYKLGNKGDRKYDELITGIIVGIGLALHNFPEGLAIGSGFGASIKLRVFSCNCHIAP